MSSFIAAFSSLISLARGRVTLLNLTLGLAVAVVILPAAFGQSSQVTGVVTDPSGAVVVGASVSLTEEGTHTVLTSITNEQGAYRFSALTEGQYTLAVEAKGFNASSARVVVAAGQISAIQNLALSVKSSIRVDPGFVRHVRERLPRGQPGAGHALWRDAHREPSLHDQCDFAPVDRRHHVEKLQGSGQVPAPGFFPGDAGTRDCAP